MPPTSIRQVPPTLKQAWQQITQHSCPACWPARHCPPPGRASLSSCTATCAGLLPAGRVSQVHQSLSLICSSSIPIHPRTPIQGSVIFHSVTRCRELPTSPIWCCLAGSSFPAVTAHSLSHLIDQEVFAPYQAQHGVCSMSSLQVFNVASFPGGQRPQERSRPILHPTNGYVQPPGGSISTHTTYINIQHCVCELDRPKTVPLPTPAETTPHLRCLPLLSLRLPAAGAGRWQLGWDTAAWEACMAAYAARHGSKPADPIISSTAATTGWCSRCAGSRSMQPPGRALRTMCAANNGFTRS